MNIMEERKLIEQYFRTKYPEERYIMKTYYHIDDISGDSNNKLYIIEFIDTQIKHSKKMEIQVRVSELFNFNF